MTSAQDPPASPLRPEPIELAPDHAPVVSPHSLPPAEEIMPAPRGPFEVSPEPPEPPRAAPDLWSGAAAAVALAAGERAFEPTRTTPVSRTPDWRPTASAESQGEVAPPPAPLAARADVPLYRPRVEPPALVAAPGAPSGPTNPTAPTDDAPRKPRRTWPLVLAGLGTLALIGGGIAWLARPDSVTPPAQRIITVAATPPLDPVVLTDPAPLLAALPATAGMWAMTAAETHDALTDHLLPGRIAEWHTVTYSDGTSEVTLVARQLYTPADARTALATAAGGEDALTPAIAGERAQVTLDGATHVLWTHDAAYFDASGEADAVVALVDALGL